MPDLASISVSHPVTVTDDADYDDMVSMDNLTPSTILHNIQHRYLNDKIYTNVSNILIAVNPYTKIQGLYEEAALQRYTALNSNNSFDDQYHTPSPHIYAIAHSAYQQALGLIPNSQPQSQSIVISGESGAGKTETTKHILNYLTYISKQTKQQFHSYPATSPDSFSQPTSLSSNKGISLNSTFHRNAEFAAAVSAAITSNIEHKLLEANPILESFGNAKTLRNDNSSRFGKWLNIQLSLQGEIIGGRIDHYLLESSRVVRQTNGERNYNIFYQLAKHRKIKVQHYHYLNQSDCYQIEGVDDGIMYNKVIAALNILGIIAQQQQSLLDIVMGILELGNIEFDLVAQPGGKEGSDINESSISALNEAARLLGFPVILLRNALITKVIVSPRSTIINMPRSPKEAIENRDSIAKTLYSSMVALLIEKINQSIASSSSSSSSSISAFPSAKSSTVSIGILDIFGFECFPNNGFEQLCINFANEKLHQQFLSYVFKQEAAVYKAEGITALVNLTFTDNQQTVDLLEKKPMGIFPLLTEEVNFPKGSDSNLLQKLCSAHSRHPAFTHPKVQGTSLFSIQHYASAVEYTVTGMCNKNGKKMGEQMRSLLEASKIGMIREMMILERTGELKSAEELCMAEEEMEEVQIENKENTVASVSMSTASNKVMRYQETLKSDTTSQLFAARPLPSSQLPSRQSSFSVTGRGIGRQQTASTVSSAFQQSLTELLTSISLTHSHFVRCIKPNAAKKDHQADESMISTQLQNNGVIDAIAVRKQGFSERMNIAEFVMKYRLLAGKQTKKVSDQRTLATIIINSVIPNNDTAKRKGLPLWQLGMTKIFYRQPVAYALQQHYLHQTFVSATLIQRHVKGWLVRKGISALKVKWRLVQSALKAGRLDKIEAALTELKSCLSSSSLISPEILQQCERHRHQIQVGEGAQNSLLKALTMYSASIKDRLRLLSTSIAMAVAVPDPLYPTWYPSLSPLLVIAQSATSLLKSLQSSLATLITSLSQQDQQMNEKYTHWLESAQSNMNTMTIKPMKEKKLDPTSISNISSLAEVVEVGQQISNYQQLSSSLHQAIKLQDRVSLGNLLHKTESSQLQWAVINTARSHYEALTLMHEVDSAVESWNVVEIQRVLDSLRQVSINKQRVSEINSCLVGPLSIESMLGTCEASLVACQNEHEAAATARNTLKLHSQDRRRLLFAIQLAEDALYMTHHSRRSTLGREIKPPVAQKQQTQQPANSDDNSLPALVDALRTQCTRLELLAQQQVENKKLIEEASNAIKQAQSETADEAQIKCAIELAQKANLKSDLIAVAQFRLTTVQTISLLVNAITERTLSALTPALKVATHRLKNNELDVRSAIFKDRYQQAQAVITVLENLNEVQQCLEGPVSRLTADRDERIARRNSSVHSIADSKLIEEVEEEGSEWQLVIDELKHAIQKARLNGAKDTEMTKAIEVVLRHEQRVQSRTASVADRATTSSNNQQKREIVRGIQQQQQQDTHQTSVKALTETEKEKPKMLGGVRVMFSALTPPRPSVPQPTSAGEMKSNLANNKANPVSSISSSPRVDHLPTPRSADAIQAAQTALMIERSACIEAEKKRRLDKELLEQAAQEVGAIHCRSVEAPGGPVVLYDHSLSNSNSNPAVKRKLALHEHKTSNSLSQSQIDQISQHQGRLSDSVIVIEEGICRVVRVSNENWVFDCNELENSHRAAPFEISQDHINQQQKQQKNKPDTNSQQSHCGCQCVIS